MRAPIEKLLDRAIKKLPEPGAKAISIWPTLTEYQITNLIDIYPYLHGASHGYGQAGPARRRLQDKGLIQPKDDGWIPTRLGYEVIAIHFQIIERKNEEDAEVRKIINLVQKVILNRDWSSLMRIVQSSRRPESAVGLIKKLLPGVIYHRDTNHHFGAKFILPEHLSSTRFLTAAIKKCEAETLLTYDI